MDLDQLLGWKSMAAVDPAVIASRNNISGGDFMLLMEPGSKKVTKDPSQYIKSF